MIANYQPLTPEQADSIWRSFPLDVGARGVEFVRHVETAAIENYLAQHPAPHGSNDERIALDLLDVLFTAYENGCPCYDSPHSNDLYIGNAFRLDDETFKACADLLNRRRPRAAIAAAKGAT